ncbi:MAG: hypothetical protein J6D37_00725 [Clostridia bacterium]|nr:hypothetical protein [Clostridia bacterium]
MKKSFAVFALLGALSLTVLAGCGPEKPTEPPKTTATTTAPSTTVPVTPEPTTPPLTKQDYIDDLKKTMETSLNQSDIFLELRVKTKGFNFPIAIVRSGGGTESEIYGVSLFNYDGREIYYTNGYQFTYVDEVLESKEPVEENEDFFEQLKTQFDEQYDEEKIEISRTEEEDNYVYTITLSGLDKVDFPTLPEFGGGDAEEFEGIFGPIEEMKLPETLTLTLTTDKEKVLSLSFQAAFETEDGAISLTVTATFLYGEEAEYPFYAEVKEQAAAGKV